MSVMGLSREENSRRFYADHLPQLPWLIEQLDPDEDELLAQMESTEGEGEAEGPDDDDDDDGEEGEEDEGEDVVDDDDEEDDPLDLALEAHYDAVDLASTRASDDPLMTTIMAADLQSVEPAATAQEPAGGPGGVGGQRDTAPVSIAPPAPPQGQDGATGAARRRTRR